MAERGPASIGEVKYESLDSSSQQNHDPGDTDLGLAANKSDSEKSEDAESRHGDGQDQSTEYSQAGPGPTTEGDDDNMAGQGTAASIWREETDDLLPLPPSPAPPNVVSFENERPPLGLSRRGLPYNYCDYE